jgi:HD-GYP domain-containing protein (c-di-GMP phosphodiesterase class II)
VPPAPAVPPVPESSGEDPQLVFEELQALLTDVRGLVRGGGAFPWDALADLVQRVAASLERSPDLFWVANNPAAPSDVDYLAFHQARVAVMAVRIGANSGADPTRLRTLGMAGALIDVGLWQMPESILRRSDALAGEELTAYRSHPRISADTIRRWGVPDERILQAVLEHHEREQGQGFPQGLTGAGVDPDAKILGLADLYAAFTVPATARPRLRPHEAVREIVKSRHEAFPTVLVKALLSEISVFPPGTVVRLNTEEIGRVVAVNRNHPLRPRVQIMTDSKGQRLPAAKTVDLSESPFLYITGPVTEGSR